MDNNAVEGKFLSNAKSGAYIVGSVAVEESLNLMLKQRDKGFRFYVEVRRVEVIWVAVIVVELL